MRDLHELWTTDRDRRISCNGAICPTTPGKRQLGRFWFDTREETGQPPRVLMKFGSNDVMRGRTPTGVFDLGTVAASLADALGASSFHLLVVGGAGTEKAVLDPRSFRYVPAPAELIAAEWATPVVDLTHPEEWTLFDLRPLRAAASRGQLGELPPRVERTPGEELLGARR